MSEDRLDRALQEMQQEAVDAATLEAVRARVWNTLTEHGRCRLCGVPARLPRVSRAEPSPAAGACCWKTMSAAAPRVAPRWPR